MTLSFNLETRGRARRRGDGDADHRDDDAAVDGRDALPGHRAGVPGLVAGARHDLLLAIFVIYVVLGVLYESFIHPLTILSGLPRAGSARC